MTKQILFIQGGGAGAHDDWDNKLVASLMRELGQGYDIRLNDDLSVVAADIRSI